MTSPAPSQPADPRTVRVDRWLPARPQAVFDVLAAPARHAELAGSDQVLGVAAGSPQRLTLGARFGMRTQQARLAYVSANEVVEFDDPRVIAWRTWGIIRGRKRVGGHLWRFVLTPEGEGTRVVHDYEWWRAMTPRALRLLRYPQRTEHHMRATLERLERLTSPGGSAAGSR